MPFRFLSRFRLPPRTQRRLGRFGAAALRGVTYPFRLVAALAAAVGRRFADWWDTRNLRFLLQGLPSLVTAVAVFVFGVVVFFQDQAVLANHYRDEGWMSLIRAQQALGVSKDAKTNLAMAQTCYHRLSRLQPDTDENSFRMA